MAGNDVELSAIPECGSQRPASEGWHRHQTPGDRSDADHAGAVGKTDRELTHGEYTYRNLTEGDQPPSELADCHHSGCDLSEGKDASGELADGDEPMRFQSGVEYLHFERR